MAIPPGQDWNRTGLIAVLTLWTRFFIWIVFMKGLGMMLPILRDQFDTTTWVIGWIVSSVNAVSGGIGPLAGLIGRQCGYGLVIMVCGAMIAVAAIAGSLVSTVQQLAVILILLAGTAGGVSSVLAKELVGRCFDKNYATANGIARTGASIGLLALPPLIQLFINTYGWRGTMILIGGILAHLVVCGALLMTSSGRRCHEANFQRLPSDEPNPVQHNNCLSSCSASWKSAVKNLDLGLLSNPRYWSLSLIYCNTRFTRDAATFVTVAGVGNLVSGICQGFIVDRGVLPSWALMGLGLATSTLMYVTTPWLNSYWTVMMSACLIVFADGILSPLKDVLVKQMLGAELLAGAFGWIGLKSSLFGVALGFLPGWLYDSTGSYDASFVLLGCMQLLSLTVLLALRCRQCLD